MLCGIDYQIMVIDSLNIQGVGVLHPTTASRVPVRKQV